MKQNNKEIEKELNYRIGFNECHKMVLKMIKEQFGGQKELDKWDIKFIIDKIKELKNETKQ